MKAKIRISVLVSGGGTNLQSLIDNINNGSLPQAEIVQVVSSSKDAFALERAKEAGIKGVVVSKSDFPEADELAQKLICVLEEANTDLVVLAGYMSVIHPDVIRKYQNQIINIHPSLIPKYSGKGFYGMRVHKAVIEAGEKVSGATVHFVDAGIDTGEIILQREVPVKEGDNESTLAARVLELEHIILSEAIRMICESKNS